MMRKTILNTAFFLLFIIVGLNVMNWYQTSTIKPTPTKMNCITQPAHWSDKDKNFVSADPICTVTEWSK